ncbi:VWA domain-containing protein [Parapusillimonas sp. SGNA-6]|nr:VWA domain-containing protein [Parapusillimonas sp. SGNA-6]
MKRFAWVKRLASHQRGAVAPLFLISSAAVLATSFGAIDLVRYNVVQGKLQSALDGATLSAGRNLANLTPTTGETQNDQWRQDAFDYFRANLPDGYMGSTVLPEDLRITYSEEPSAADNYMAGQFINMEVSGTLPLLSTGFLKVSSLNLHASNRAVRRVPTDIELVMALDNTGSMAGTKLETLKDAAKQLSTIVLGAKDAKEGEPPRDIRVGLVPFADTVNVGNTEWTQRWLTYPVAQDYFIKNLWKGCIVEPPETTWGGNDLPASVLTPTRIFQPLHLTFQTKLDRATLGLASAPGVYERIWKDLPGAPQPRVFDPPDQASLLKFDRRVWASRGSDSKAKDTSFEIYTAGNPANCLESRKSRFLDDDPDDIKAAIDAMGATGSTLVPTGLLWAWRMLHPAWTGAWDGSERPRPADPRTLRKVIVLLTDGKNEPPNTIGSSETRIAYTLKYDVESCTDKDFKNCSPTPVTDRPYAPPDDYAIPKPPAQAPMNSLKMRDPEETDGKNSKNQSIGWGKNDKISTSTVNNYLAALCTQVKNDGNDIKIYTVTLGALDSTTETLMNNCSSGAGYFYNTKTVSDLPQVFRSIAGALTELRLTE